MELNIATVSDDGKFWFPNCLQTHGFFRMETNGPLKHQRGRPDFN